MKPTTRDHGFTLVEVLVALTILVTVMAIVGQTFFTTLNAWNKGSKLADELHHGDFVMDQLESALRSAAHFKTSPGKLIRNRFSGDGGTRPGRSA